MVTDGPSGADNAHDLPTDIAVAVQAIRDDQEHGASWLARAAARTLQRAGEARRELPGDEWAMMVRATAQALAAVRPSMAAVANTAARIWGAGQDVSAEGDRQAMLTTAARLASQHAQTQQSLITHAEQALVGSVYTISRSGTVENVLRVLGHRGNIDRVIVAESRPGGEGVALGQALAAGGLNVTLAADAACGIFIAEASCVALGADSLRADGSVVNKVGSYPLALVAREAGRPVYVICETLKIAAPDFPLALEEKDPAELLPDARMHLSARNPYFDVTPAGLIAAYITEVGILNREAVARYAAAAGKALARLMAG